LPTLGLYTTLLSTVAAEVRVADRALDYFAMLWYDAPDSFCGINPDPNLSWCLDSALAFMLNSSEVWEGVSRLYFYITYSNDVDRGNGGMFVGPAGAQAWLSRVNTWVSAMKHPRYLSVNGRPVFEVLIPEIFVAQCGGNVTLTNELLAQLKSAAVDAGVGEPIVGGGWQNPSVPYNPPPPRPHPNGYMTYPSTDIPCKNCDIQVLDIQLEQCEAACNATAGCTAFIYYSPPEPQQCVLKSVAGPGAPGSGDAFVRVLEATRFDFTATYNSAPPLCPGAPAWVCPQYVNSWLPNATPSGAKIFPYSQCSDFQAAARGNHSQDSIPYLPNLIAGFDPRPWEEESPSFSPPSPSEWEAALQQVKEFVSIPTNSKFGFPDASQPNGIQPAACIYAWNEFGEGGILAPTQGAGTMMIDTVARVFPR